MNIYDIHTKPLSDTYRAADSAPEGLSSAEVAERRELYGENVLDEGKKKNLLMRIADQLKNPMIIVLIVAGVVSGAFGEWIDMLIILFVVAVNTVMGIVQEGKAEAAIEALKAMSSPHAKVRRDGVVISIDAKDLVPGDVCELEAGDSVPADMRLVESASLKIEEAALTGESVPAEKDANEVVSADAVLGDRVNMAYNGTSVVYGRAVGVVTSTGMSTEMGKIAGSLLNTEDGQTPLQKKLSELSKILTIIVVGVCVVIFGISLIKDGTDAMLDTFLMAVSLAVAAIPEGLAAVVTIIMAMGVQKMAGHGAIIRKLPAVETLGCTQIVCSDKTGTLTQNRMTVERLFADGKFLDGRTKPESAGFERLTEAMAFCNDTKISADGLLGDPTETALVSYALSLGVHVETKLALAPRVSELPFDSERKLMTTFHQNSGKLIQYTKGAPDVLIDRCDRALIGGSFVAMTDELRAALKKANDKMASDALRVLGAAMEVRDEIPADMTAAERNLVFLGLMGMIDPARPEVKKAVATAKKAGVRPIMITGDHITTAVAIARELGILDDGSLAITGAELDKIPDEEFDRTVEKYCVYARVSPEHKVKIVSAWQKRGNVCAMTGDGVNDAPALKKADIGVGMGITGTDVTKSVADMVLTDDNFATIILAVSEGRRLYANMRKTVQYLLGANLAEVLSVLVATLLGINILHTIHILWINLVSDMFPALALGLEPAEADVMNQPPRPSNEGIFAGGVGLSIAYQGFTIAALTLISYFIGAKTSAITGSTMAFCTLTLCQMFHSLNVRSLTGSLFKIGLFTNKLSFGAIAVSVALMLCVVMIPGINTIFHVVALDAMQWLVVFALSLTIIPVVEVVKIIKRYHGVGK